MEIQEHRTPIGDEARDMKIYHMATCPRCGGRGGTYDSQGNWIECGPCGGTGQV